jgi:hypothetical protein
MILIISTSAFACAMCAPRWLPRLMEL